MKRLIPLVALALATLTFNQAVAQAAAADSLRGSRPNIVFVITDDQGMGDLACLGNEVLRTPNLDRLYRQSTRLTDFHVSPTCAPTRSALMSGRPPFKVGVTHTIRQRERLAPDVYTLPQALQSAGYATGLFGKWHLGDAEAYLPQNRGFDEVLMHGAGGIGQVRLGDFPPNSENVYFDNVLLHNDTIVQTKGYCTDIFFQAALNWIKQQEGSAEPYFAYIALNAPHGPLVAPEKYSRRFRELGYDKGTAGRYGMIENIDDNVGLLMQKLEQWNALDDTLVVFMTDNGAAHLRGTLNGQRVQHFNFQMRGGKNSPYEGGTHVPAFFRWKGILGEGVDIDGLTAHLDIYPTFAELAGAKLPDDMQPLDGSYIEGFEGAVGMSRKDYVAKGMEAFQKAARDGAIIAFTCGLGDNQQDADEAPRSAGGHQRRSGDAQSRFDYQLAIFLACAEQYSYFDLHDGYDAKTSKTWMTHRPEYDRPLGPPRGPAVRDGYIFTRQFAHASVRVDIENETGSIVWSK
ncbi:sulfatase-like hydrolase/transferase [Roseimaritima sediminicola]|uniref:sulfatase-like hydrolase/transferase n=1 Tax=Roseimaritima sediminicola TaxID=2662066 RepID=UPI0013866D53|nr:sulfatase-like hydrolase/transferase [Roseimaritima sediminicola]